MYVLFIYTYNRGTGKFWIRWKYIKQICFLFIFYVIKANKFTEAWCKRLLNDFKFFTSYYAFNKENDEF
jgi:hypothetical protein